MAEQTPTLDPISLTYGRKDLAGGLEAQVIPLVPGSARLVVGIKGASFYEDVW